ncbi:MAG: secD [Firmicutes bacterium]|nr:secD [Bacillota bacterium]
MVPTSPRRLRLSIELVATNGEISIYMDQTLISSPRVINKITDGKAMITNIGTSEEALALAQKINAGALPFALEAISSSSISPSLGSGALKVMTLAGLVALALICLFMLLYYRLPGFVAIFSLVGQMVGILLAISIPQQTLTLQGIAGIILSIGMGVDANIIIAERIKEELNAGSSLTTALANGFHKAFSAVMDGNVTVAIAAVVLMIFGSGSMLSFGYSLFVGVVLNGLTGVIANRLMIGSLSQFRPLQNPRLYGRKKVIADA